MNDSVKAQFAKIQKDLEDAGLHRAINAELEGLKQDFQRQANRYMTTPILGTSTNCTGVPITDLGRTVLRGDMTWGFPESYNADWTCSYCKGKQPSDKYNCNGCGAPKL